MLSGVAAQFEFTPVLTVGIFIGIVMAFVFIAFGITMALKLRANERLRRRQMHQQHGNDKPYSTRPGNLAIKDKISMPLGVVDLDDVCDDKNPDVVPYNEGGLCDWKLNGTFQVKNKTRTDDAKE